MSLLSEGFVRVVGDMPDHSQQPFLHKESFISRAEFLTCRMIAQRVMLLWLGSAEACFNLTNFRLN